jgi:hypothetical protein
MTRAAGTALLALLAGASVAGAQPIPPGVFRYERSRDRHGAGPAAARSRRDLLAGTQAVTSREQAEPAACRAAGPPDLRLYTDGRRRGALSVRAPPG